MKIIDTFPYLKQPRIWPTPPFLWEEKSEPSLFFKNLENSTLNLSPFIKGGARGGRGGVPKNYVKIERFVTKVNSFWALAIVAKLSVLDVSASHGYVSEQ